MCPIILASDKTQLTTLSGGQQAWPVYLMIGNISKCLRRRPGEGASLLVRYILANNLETCYAKETECREARWKLFHDAMKMIVKPFAKVLQKGEEMGWFEHGSTIVLFAPAGSSLCGCIEEGSKVRAGQALMRLPRAAAAGTE